MFLRTLFFNIAALLIATAGISCSVTSYTSSPAPGLQAMDQAIVLQAGPGPVRIQRIAAADWAVDRSGLINLDDPIAQKAGLEDGLEPIQIYMYILDHPKFGRVIVDSGISSVFEKDASEWPVSSLVQSAMNTDKLKLLQTTKSILGDRMPKAVLLTHMHMDHIMGLGDIPTEIPILVGPGEASASSFLNAFVQGTTDELVGHDRKILELAFNKKDQALPSLDYFGDGSLMIFWSPGHTPGSLAFLVRATDGPHLIVGDTCHTAWGWRNGVTPGSFTADQAANRQSLETLKELATKIPNLKIYPGHQSLD